MQIANLEDIHKLSPVQQEMLERALAHPGDDADVVQVCAALSGPLSLPALEAAWERTAARHSALRTLFRPGKVPSQVVQRQVKLPFAVHERKTDAEIASFLVEDRARGLDPIQGPLLRLSVLRTAPGEHLLVWTYHRLVLDGWSAALVASQVLAGSRGGPEPERSRRFRDYLDGLRGHDPAEAERFWRQELDGLSPMLLGSPEPLPGRTGHDARTVRLAASATAALRTLADGQGLAFETLLQGAWALLLSRQTGREDVVFGITAAGRPASLPEAGSMAGRFSNTLPLRVRVEPEVPLLDCLRRLEERRKAAEPFAHVPLSQIRAWAGAALFDSRLSTEHVPLSSEGQVRWIETSTGPLTLFVQPGAELALEAVYDRSRFEEAEIANLQERLCALLESFTSGDFQAAESGHRLDRIARMVHSRDVPTHEPEALPERREPGTHEIMPVPRNQPLPATFYQEWALQLDGVTKNCIPSALRIKGPVDLTALRRSLAEIVRRHESLRTSFRWEDGQAFLALASPSDQPAPAVDLAALPEERRTALLQELVTEHAGHEFDMERGPLFIAQIVRLGDQDHALLMNAHHLISDGWSIQVLQRELVVLYAAFSQGRPSPLPPLPIQLADFAWWQRRVFAGEALAAQLSWWRNTLANLPPPPRLPIDRPRPEVVGPRAVSLNAALAPEPAKSLRTLAQTTRSSLPMVLLAAVDALLHAYSGEEDLTVSMIFAARNRPELSGQIGLFMNTVPLRTRFSGVLTFRELVERVRDATIEAYSHQDVPFPRLLTELFPGRKLTRTILTGVCFNMLSFSESAGAASDGTKLGGLSFQMIGLEEGGAKHDLAVTSFDDGSSVYFDLTGAADLFTPGRLETVTRDFEALLARVAADPDVPLSRLRELVSPA